MANFSSRFLLIPGIRENGGRRMSEINEVTTVPNAAASLLSCQRTFYPQYMHTNEKYIARRQFFQEMKRTSIRLQPREHCRAEQSQRIHPRHSWHALSHLAPRRAAHVRYLRGAACSKFELIMSVIIWLRLKDKFFKKNRVVDVVAYRLLPPTSYGKHAPQTSFRPTLFDARVKLTYEI